MVDAAVRISWTAPSSNYKTITAYQVGIRDYTGTAYQSELAHCDASSAVIRDSLYCDVPVSVLRAAPFALVLGDLVVAQVRAYNELGWGAFSGGNVAGATIQTEPTAMAAPMRGAATATDRLALTWTLLTSPGDGGSPATTYALSWDKGTAGVTWESLVGESSDYTLSSFLVTGGVTVGASYRFTVRARNFWGWGAASPVATIVAATAPAKVTTATTSVKATTGAVLIAWAAPDARGDPITSYTVEIQDATASSWTAETADCGGTAALLCTVPMAVLRAWPYSLAQGALVVVRVSASNSYGTGPASQANTAGVSVRVAPLSMNAPTRGAETSTG